MFIIPDDIFLHMRIEYPFSEHVNFIFIRSIGFLWQSRRRHIRRFQNFGDILEIRMMYNIIQSVKTDMSESGILVPVLLRPGLILTVIDMKNSDLLLSQNPVEFVQNDG